MPLSVKELLFFQTFKGIKFFLSIDFHLKEKALYGYGVMDKALVCGMD